MLSSRSSTGDITTNKMFFPPKLILSLLCYNILKKIWGGGGGDDHYFTITAIDILMYFLPGYIKYVCGCNNTKYKKKIIPAFSEEDH